MSPLSNNINVSLNKFYAVIGGCAVVGLSAYVYYTYNRNKKRMIDEGFEDITVTDDSVKKVLVLGLDGAGKSTFLTELSKTETNCKAYTNAKGFSGVSLQCKNGKSLNVSEIGDSPDIRLYWSNFVQDADSLVYIVDSSDEHRLAESVKELRILTACDKLKNIPIFVLANKQDLPTAASPKNIADAFGVLELSQSIKIIVHPLAMPTDIQETNKSVLEVKDMLVQVCFG